MNTELMDKVETTDTPSPTTESLSREEINKEIDAAIKAHDKKRENQIKSTMQQTIIAYEHKKIEDSKFSRLKTFVWGSIMAITTLATFFTAISIENKEQSYALIGSIYLIMMAILELSNYPAGREKNIGSGIIRIIFGVLALTKFFL